MQPTTRRGLDALTAAWAALHPGVTPIDARFGLSTVLGGAIDGVLAFPLEDHWLLVSYGLSELDDKETSVPEVSGSGFELTARVARDPRTVLPPQWMIQVINGVARSFVDGMDLSLGDWIVGAGALGGSAQAGPLTSVTIVADPELPRIDTANGVVHFWTVVGLTGPEGLAAQEAGTAEPLVAALRERSPLLITDPARPGLV
ncbi:hypothetical protein Aph02nite_40770 [Actinoplanes philippinensis]|uniref:Suppressor of fused protein (SUFU) n=1 Tax=Actinoplanes philippinensis TaxID=35752 RepID=A0A1I2GXG8_9ACTN|nr:suppressor of fused domain protein [Actinoplanes philippinensis]GIE78127.1 hypothetical protein Aph02nite_40770 [Actinoplanes philippinensis]SFF21296.1 Suppressor of fused protein (SUFU) [Actinoplanes philippinensis]